MFNNLKKDHLNSRKNQEKIKSNLLGTIIAECTKTAKDPSDEIITSTIKKFLKNNNETQNAIKDTNNASKLSELLLEEEILKYYLPKMLDEQEIRDIITVRKDNGDNNLGVIMKFFKTHYENSYDGALVSKIAKEVLSGD